MYLVELQPGKEATYQTLADFADAIRRGEVGWQARIYHQGKSLWIPVTLHPHFRKFAGSRPADPRSAPRAHWTFLPARPGEEVPVSTQGPTTAGEEGSSSASDTGQSASSPRNWRRMLGGLIRARRS